MAARRGESVVPRLTPFQSRRSPASSVSRGPVAHRSAVLSVIDRGPGLDDAGKARATERFWRADQHRRGSGLGLAIAAALVDAGGGDLRLVDTPGGGLTVRIVMQAAADPAAADERVTGQA